MLVFSAMTTGGEPTREKTPPPLPPRKETPPKPNLVFTRQWEPKERAFSLLVPEGWKTEGGIFNVNPMQMNGPGNSMAPKCDFTVFKDARKSVYINFVPSWNYADLSMVGSMAPAAAFFTPGSNYNGMKVRPMLSARAFLEELFRTKHPEAAEIKVVHADPMSEIVEGYVKNEATLNQQLQAVGVGGFRYQAGAIVIEYSEGGERYRHILFTALRDGRSFGMWCNEWTMAARAPLKEADYWKAVLDTVRVSVKFNAQWLATVTRNADERGKTMLETQQYIARLDREIFENRSRTRSHIQNEQYLLITGREEYTNPFTNEVEVDSSDYKHRWVTSDGRYLYSDKDGFNPNQDESFRQFEWKETAPKAR